MTNEIKLGSVYKDKVTGFKGVAVSLHEYLNGCIRVSIQPRTMYECKPAEPQNFDIEQLEATDESGVTITKRDTGGPQDVPKQRPVPGAR